MDREIAKRKVIGTKGESFNQEELWYLLYQLTGCSRVFQRVKKRKTGDIRPKNILINENGQIRLINCLSFPDEKTNYLKATQDSTVTYLAPEQLTDWQNNLTYPRADSVVAQSFSIGLTILDAALLFDSELLYSIRPVLGFKNHIFNENIVKWKSLPLSPFLIRTVLNMLEVKPLERPSPGEVNAILEPYEKEIMALRQFSPHKVKSKESLERFQSGKL